MALPYLPFFSTFGALHGRPHDPSHPNYVIRRKYSKNALKWLQAQLCSSIRSKVIASTRAVFEKIRVKIGHTFPHRKKSIFFSKSALGKISLRLDPVSYTWILIRTGEKVRVMYKMSWWSDGGRVFFCQTSITIFPTPDVAVGVSPGSKTLQLFKYFFSVI